MLTSSLKENVIEITQINIVVLNNVIREENSTF